MLVPILILNYNGRHLMAECLPSILKAARSSRHRCEVIVVDNDSDDDSTDDSAAWLAQHYPEVRVIPHANRGLCSYNDVVPGLPGRVVVLLNNDIKLAPDAIDPLVEPLLGAKAADAACLMTAPLCWLFDGKTYEGFKTAVRWRWGLVQGTALFSGHEPTIHHPGLTASVGAAMAVDRDKFAELGGFDPIYLPGRIEDLDFSFRGYMAGYHIRYVPEAIAYHRGMASFGPAFGASGCDRLALRNTLLFQWKNLRHPAHVARQLFGLPLRVLLDIARSPWVPRERRWMFTLALAEALRRLPRLTASRFRPKGTVRLQGQFFQRFHPSAIGVAK